MSKKYNLYLGQAGQNFISSEYLIRGYNIALPLVDVGDDVFVVQDEAGLFSRIQVKTSTGTPMSYGFSARYNLPWTQVETYTNPELYYAFAVRFNKVWQPPVLISRTDLLKKVRAYNIGTLQNGRLLLYFRFETQPLNLTCSGRDLSDFINNWQYFPVVPHGQRLQQAFS